MLCLWVRVNKTYYKLRPVERFKDHFQSISFKSGFLRLSCFYHHHQSPRLTIFSFSPSLFVVHFLRPFDYHHLPLSDIHLFTSSVSLSSPSFFPSTLIIFKLDVRTRKRTYTFIYTYIYTPHTVVSPLFPRVIDLAPLIFFLLTHPRLPFYKFTNEVNETPSYSHSHCPSATTTPLAPSFLSSCDYFLTQQCSIILLTKK